MARKASFLLHGNELVKAAVARAQVFRSMVGGSHVGGDSKWTLDL
jgi:hypothetical protein